MGQTKQQIRDDLDERMEDFNKRSVDSRNQSFLWFAIQIHAEAMVTCTDLIVTTIEEESRNIIQAIQEDNDA